MKAIIDTFNPLQDEFYRNGKDKYSQKRLVEISKKYKPFKLPLKHIDTWVSTWKLCDTVNDFAWHAKRALRANLKYPVLMDRYGSIMNGWHRIVKALILDKEYVWCVRIEENIEPDK